MAEPIPVEVNEAIRIYDQVTGTWLEAYLNIGTQKKTVDLSGGVVADCRKFRKFILMVSGTAPALPATLQVQVQFSWNASQWYNYMTGDFYDLASDGAGDIDEAYSGDWAGYYIRAVVTGATAAVRVTLVT